MIAREKIQGILDRFEYLEAKLAEGGGGADFAAMSRDYADLRPVAEQARALLRLIDDAEAARAMLDDPEMRRELEAMLDDIIR
jgi:peptide chain release factor 1